MAVDKHLVQEFTQLLSTTTEKAPFFGSSQMEGPYTSSQVRQFYQGDNEVSVSMSSHFTPHVDNASIESVIEYLRLIFGDLVVPDKAVFGQDSIKNRLNLIGGTTTYEIYDFAIRLIRATAILGPTRSIQLLLEWVEGKPIRYWQHAVLDGISVEQPLNLDGVICVTQLPNTSKEMDRHMPSLVRGINYTDVMYAGCAKLSIAYEATLPEPTTVQEQSGIVHSSPIIPTRKSIGIEDFDLDSFCEALALTCNHYVSWMSEWYDCGDWKLFGIIGGGSMRRDFSRSSTKLSYEQLEDARSLLALRQTKTTEPRLNIAIERWLQSKRRGGSLADSLIDLRIALETLYLPDASGEVRFRVSTHGAWHLGEDYEGRSRYQTILRDAYDLASRAVHAGAVDITENNRRLLDNAQDLCRAAILKRLRDSGEPKWNELILGRGLESSS